MDIYTSIAQNLDLQARETLEVFRTAERPLPAELNDLPSGFLFLSHLTPSGEPLFVLGDFGRKVAEAADRLAQSGKEAA